MPRPSPLPLFRRRARREAVAGSGAIQVSGGLRRVLLLGSAFVSGSLCAASLLIAPGAGAQNRWPPPVPPPPAREPQRLPQRFGTASTAETGQRLEINGRRQTARWEQRGSASRGDLELWLPLEVLEGQLGFTSRSSTQGGLELEWFGRTLLVPAGAQRSLDDEVAVDVSRLLLDAGVSWQRQERGTLRLELPAATLEQIRVSSPGAIASSGVRRVVLDLSGPAFVRREAGELQMALRSTPAQLAQLQSLGLQARPGSDGLTIALPASGPGAVLTLGGPARVVLDLAGAAPGPVRATAPSTAQLQALLNKGITVERQVRALGNRRMLVNSVRLDPRRSPVELRLLTSTEGMEGLTSLPQLAGQEQALVAINGGFFNRVRRLPLGALKDDGRWLSGPILNRGAVGWQDGAVPQFGWLSLTEWVSDGSGQRLPVMALNSGYVQRGLARYTAEWGRSYRAISGGETALLVNGSVVRQQFNSAQLEQGIALGPEDVLLVGRGGVVPPWDVGSRLSLSSQPTHPLGQSRSVLGGGPLLLLNGRTVLNGSAEGFSAAFLQQGAPRTVIASDGSQIWLLTLQGVEHAGPTLRETAQLLQQLGLRDALNLDGGSSTGLMLSGTLSVQGRGVAARIHNGLGLVPRDPSRAADASEGSTASSP